MDTDSQNLICTTCDGPLTSGPLGLRCARCVLSLLEDDENEVNSYLSELFPELHLLGKIAQGGFGAVWRAEHRRLRRPVALKFLDSVLARNAEAVALFQQEMVSVGRLDHTGIVRAHDAGERDGHWYIIMEFVEGMDCGALVRKHGFLPIAESCEIIRQAALALDYAHGQGLVHRDVKPGNVMVSQTDTSEQPDRLVRTDLVKVLDFGLAGLAMAPVFSLPVAPDGSTLFLGTLEYISPEQIESPATVDARADIYSLGATLWRLLTGKTPHGANSPEMSLFAAMKRITTEAVPSLATLRPDVPPPLVKLCDAMLSLGREKRPASAAELARLILPWCAGAELSRLFTDGPLEEKPFVAPKKNRQGLWAASIGAAAMVAVFQAGKNTTPTALPQPAAPPVRFVFSPEFTALRHLDADSAPLFRSPDWEPEREIFTDTRPLSASFLPDGRIAFLKRWTNYTMLCALGPGEPGEKAVTLFEEKDDLEKMKTFVVAPDGHFAVSHTNDPKAFHMRRCRPDGALLKAIRYNFAAELPKLPYDLGQQLMINNGKTVCDGFPLGMAVVTEGHIPANSDLHPGDVLVADQGGMNLIPGIYTSPASLWRFRFDNDERLSRLASGGETPLDVAISRHGVFMLNRTTVIATTLEQDPANFDRRILRWDKEGFHACVTDIPIHDPSGIATDPTSTDLYVIQGAHTPSVSRSVHRLVRLRLTTPDHYAVELLADRFGSLGQSGIDVSSDGRRILVTDTGNRVMVVLRKKAEAL